MLIFRDQLRLGEEGDELVSNRSVSVLIGGLGIGNVVESWHSAFRIPPTTWRKGRNRKSLAGHYFGDKMEVT